MGRNRDDVKIIRIGECDSTNSWIAHYVRHAPPSASSAILVGVADRQTAGRGQGSNSWESEPGKNLTMSLHFRPKALKAERQFVVLEGAALSIHEALPTPDAFTIKWPNDIYWHDKKLSGTLSECAISRGMVAECIVGIGINVNQKTFRSNAPNPISLINITGRGGDREAVMWAIIDGMLKYLDLMDRGLYKEIDKAYRERLFRREGVHRFRDKEGEFLATIEDITPFGHLVLRPKPRGALREYAFKEVEFII